METRTKILVSCESISVVSGKWVRGGIAHPIGTLF